MKSEDATVPTLFSYQLSNLINITIPLLPNSQIWQQEKIEYGQIKTLYLIFLMLPHSYGLSKSKIEVDQSAMELASSM